MKTVGLSKKLYPSVLAIASGIIVAAFIDKPVGLSVLLTGIASLGVGYAAPADAVNVKTIGSDAMMSPDVEARIRGGK